MKIITIGGATQDIFIHNKAVQTIEFHRNGATQSFLLFPEGSKLEVSDLTYKTGGGATNSAASFKKLDFDVRPFFKIGKDFQAKFILDELKKIELPIDLAVESTTEPTAISFIIPSPEGDSTVLVYRGANAQITQEELPFDAFEKGTSLYITSLSGKSSQLLVPITKKAKEMGMFVANNPGSSQLEEGARALREALKYMDVFILNAEEAQQFMLTLVESEAEIQHPGKHTTMQESAPELLKSLLTYHDVCFSISHFFYEITQRGPKIVVVTNGAEGVYVCDKNNIYFHPSLPTNLVSTLGAGDAFGSCFVASLLKGYSVEQSMINGIINSSSVIGSLGAKEGLLSWSQINKKAEVVGTRKIQKFKIG